ncbi:MAG: transposase [Polyangiales bacterium]
MWGCRRLAVVSKKACIDTRSPTPSGVVSKVLPLQPSGPAALKGDRLFIEAVLFRAKTGLPWRDLPERFGPWKSVYNRFSNWARKGHWEAIFKALSLEVDETGSIVDGSVVRAHQDASGGKGGSSATRWVVLEAEFPPSSTRSSTRKAVRSTSRSRRAKGTK